MARLAGNYPSRSSNGKIELKILNQPEEQHRARYKTEGSRGSVKDVTGMGHPVIKLFGYNATPVKLQCYIGHDKNIGEPHLFYQVSKITGKTSTRCTTTKVEGTSVINIDLTPENNMQSTIDCIGILKERNVDVEQKVLRNLNQNNGCNMVTSLPSKKRCAKCKLVFRCRIPGTNEIIQTVSTSILCTQPVGTPEISKMSLSECSMNGGHELFIIGKNFLKDSRVIFKGDSWLEIVEPDSEYFNTAHLICVIPTYSGPHREFSKAVNVTVCIRSGGKYSESRTLTMINPSQGSFGPYPQPLRKLLKANCLYMHGKYHRHASGRQQAASHHHHHPNQHQRQSNEIGLFSSMNQLDGSSSVTSGNLRLTSLLNGSSPINLNTLAPMSLTSTLGQRIIKSEDDHITSNGGGGGVGGIRGRLTRFVSDDSLLSSDGSTVADSVFMSEDSSYPDNSMTLPSVSLSSVTGDSAANDSQTIELMTDFLGRINSTLGTGSGAVTPAAAATPVPNVASFASFETTKFPLLNGLYESKQALNMTGGDAVNVSGNGCLNLSTPTVGQPNNNGFSSPTLSENSPEVSIGLLSGNSSPGSSSIFSQSNSEASSPGSVFNQANQLSFVQNNLLTATLPSSQTVLTQIQGSAAQGDVSQAASSQSNEIQFINQQTEPQPMDIIGAQTTSRNPVEPSFYEMNQLISGQSVTVVQPLTESQLMPPPPVPSVVTLAPSVASVQLSPASINGTTNMVCVDTTTSLIGSNQEVTTALSTVSQPSTVLASSLMSQSVSVTQSQASVSNLMGQQVSSAPIQATTVAASASASAATVTSGTPGAPQAVQASQINAMSQMSDNELMRIINPSTFDEFKDEPLKTINDTMNLFGYTGPFATPSKLVVNTSIGKL